MYKISMILFGLFIANASAQIVEVPLKSEQPEPAAQADSDKPDAIVFPPATEPYKPVDVKPVAQAHEKPLPLAQPQQQTQPAMQPQPVVQPVVQPNFNSVPPVMNYGMSAGNTREAIERAADSCAGELSRLYQQRNSAQGENRKNFDLAIGEAKVACDALQETAQTIKKADQHLNVFQEGFRRAQGSLR